MRKKPRTARAVAANLGVQKEYARRLRNALRMLLRDALRDLHQELGMAHDAAGALSCLRLISHADLPLIWRDGW